MELRLVARYYPGGSSWKPWRVTILGDGKVVREILGTASTTETIALSGQDVAGLRERIIESDYFGLPAECYPASMTDQPELSLDIRMDGKSHAASLYAPGFARRLARANRQDARKTGAARSSIPRTEGRGRDDTLLELILEAGPVQLPDAHWASARRFLRIWAEVLRRVPSPNPEDRPELYDP